MNRADVISGYRKLADLLEQHPELPVPHQGTASRLAIYMLHSDRDAFVAAVRSLPGTAQKTVDDDTYRVSVVLGGAGGLDVEVVAYRQNVCERVVTGTREVTKTIPDPMVTVPVVEVTETVEDVEWICTPLLAEVDR